MKKGRLYFTIGRPRSGKSTYCEDWVRQWYPTDCSGPRVIVASDDIRLALHGERYNFLAETTVFATKHIMIRALLNRGFDVICDGTNSSAISIQRLLEISETATAILFDTSENECINRAILSNQEDLIPAIKRISKNIEKIEAVGLHKFMENILYNEIKARNP